MVSSDEEALHNVLFDEQLYEVPDLSTQTQNHLQESLQALESSGYNSSQQGYNDLQSMFDGAADDVNADAAHYNLRFLQRVSAGGLIADPLDVDETAANASLPGSATINRFQEACSETRAIVSLSQGNAAVEPHTVDENAAGLQVPGSEKDAERDFANVAADPVHSLNKSVSLSQGSASQQNVALDAVAPAPSCLLPAESDENAAVEPRTVDEKAAGSQVIGFEKNAEHDFANVAADLVHSLKNNSSSLPVRELYCDMCGMARKVFCSNPDAKRVFECTHAGLFCNRLAGPALLGNTTADAGVNKNLHSESPGAARDENKTSKSACAASPDKKNCNVGSLDFDAGTTLRSMVWQDANSNFGGTQFLHDASSQLGATPTLNCSLGGVPQPPECKPESVCSPTPKCAPDSACVLTPCSLRFSECLDVQIFTPPAANNPASRKSSLNPIARVAAYLAEMEKGEHIASEKKVECGPGTPANSSKKQLRRNIMQNIAEFAGFAQSPIGFASAPRNNILPGQLRNILQGTPKLHDFAAYDKLPTPLRRAGLLDSDAPNKKTKRARRSSTTCTNSNADMTEDDVAPTMLVGSDSGKTPSVLLPEQQDEDLPPADAEQEEDPHANAYGLGADDESDADALMKQGEAGSAKSFMMQEVSETTTKRLGEVLITLHQFKDRNYQLVPVASNDKYELHNVSTMQRCDSMPFSRRTFATMIVEAAAICCAGNILHSPELCADKLQKAVKKNKARAICKRHCQLHVGLERASGYHYHAGLFFLAAHRTTQLRYLKPAFFFLYKLNIDVRMRRSNVKGRDGKLPIMLYIDGMMHSTKAHDNNPFRSANLVVPTKYEQIVERREQQNLRAARPMEIYAFLSTPAGTLVKSVQHLKDLQDGLLPQLAHAMEQQHVDLSLLARVQKFLLMGSQQEADVARLINRRVTVRYATFSLRKALGLALSRKCACKEKGYPEFVCFNLFAKWMDEYFADAEDAANIKFFWSWLFCFICFPASLRKWKKRNVLFVGGFDKGKSTLLNLLLSFIHEVLVVKLAPTTGKNCFQEASSKTRAILAVCAEWQHPEGCKVDVVNVALEGDTFVCPRFGQAQEDAVLPPALLATNGYEEGARTANVSRTQIDAIYKGRCHEVRVDKDVHKWEPFAGLFKKCDACRIRCILRYSKVTLVQLNAWARSTERGPDGDLPRC